MKSWDLVEIVEIDINKIEPIETVKELTTKLNKDILSY